jgi:hypothetical protein
MTRARDLASLGDNTTKLEQAGLIQIIPTSVTKGASGSGSVDSKGNVTFSGTESIALNGIFSATYDNYKIVASFNTPSADTYLSFKLRNSGTDTSTAYYWSSYETKTDGVSNVRTGSNETRVWGNATDSGNTYSYSYNVEVQNPFLNVKTDYTWVSRGFTSTGTNLTTYGGGSRDASIQDSFTFYVESGTFAGTIRIYGYNQ